MLKKTQHICSRNMMQKFLIKYCSQTQNYWNYFSEEDKKRLQKQVSHLKENNFFSQNNNSFDHLKYQNIQNLNLSPYNQDNIVDFSIQSHIISELQTKIFSQYEIKNLYYIFQSNLTAINDIYEQIQQKMELYVQNFQKIDLKTFTIMTINTQNIQKVFSVINDSAWEALQNNKHLIHREKYVSFFQNDKTSFYLKLQVYWLFDNLQMFTQQQKEEDFKVFSQQIHNVIINGQFNSLDELILTLYFLGSQQNKSLMKNYFIAMNKYANQLKYFQTTDINCLIDAMKNLSVDFQDNQHASVLWINILYNYILKMKFVNYQQMSLLQKIKLLYNIKIMFEFERNVINKKAYYNIMFENEIESFKVYSQNRLQPIIMYSSKLKKAWLGVQRKTTDSTEENSNNMINYTCQNLIKSTIMQCTYQQSLSVDIFQLMIRRTIRNLSQMDYPQIFLELGQFVDSLFKKNSIYLSDVFYTIFLQSQNFDQTQIYKSFLNCLIQIIGQKSLKIEQYIQGVLLLTQCKVKSQFIDEQINRTYMQKQKQIYNIDYLNENTIKNIISLNFKDIFLHDQQYLNLFLNHFLRNRQCFSESDIIVLVHTILNKKLLYNNQFENYLNDEFQEFLNMQLQQYQNQNNEDQQKIRLFKSLNQEDYQKLQYMFGIMNYINFEREDEFKNLFLDLIKICKNDTIIDAYQYCKQKGYLREGIANLEQVFLQLFPIKNFQKYDQFKRITIMQCSYQFPFDILQDLESINYQTYDQQAQIFYYLYFIQIQKGKKNIDLAKLVQLHKVIGNKSHIYLHDFYQNVIQRISPNSQLSLDNLLILPINISISLNISQVLNNTKFEDLDEQKIEKILHYMAQNKYYNGKFCKFIIGNYKHRTDFLSIIFKLDIDQESIFLYKESFLNYCDEKERNSMSILQFAFQFLIKTNSTKEKKFIQQLDNICQEIFVENDFFQTFQYNKEMQNYYFKSFYQQFYIDHENETLQSMNSLDFSINESQELFKTNFLTFLKTNKNNYDIYPIVIKHFFMDRYKKSLKQKYKNIVKSYDDFILNEQTQFLQILKLGQLCNIFKQMYPNSYQPSQQKIPFVGKLSKLYFRILYDQDYCHIEQQKQLDMVQTYLKTAIYNKKNLLFLDSHQFFISNSGISSQQYEKFQTKINYEVTMDDIQQEQSFLEQNQLQQMDDNEEDFLMEFDSDDDDFQRFD